MNRKDYKKLMNIKKRNKNYAKFTILASLGLGVALANSTTTHAEEHEWKANTSTTIKQGDTEYKIVWGDTLSLISKDSGLTIDTLATLNNILNYDLIFEGNIIVFGDGATAVVKDSSGNVIAETPLTEVDKQGIQEAQKNATNNNTNSTVNNNNTSTKNNGTTTNTIKGQNNNDSVINTVKPVKPIEGNGGNNGEATNPIKPIDPIKPVDPTKPVEKEYVVTINHVTETGEVLSKETRKAKANTTIETKAIDFSDRGYELVGENTQTVNVKENTTITFTYKKIDDTKPIENTVEVTIKHIGDDGKILSTGTIKAEKGSTVKADARDFTDMGYVLNDEVSKSIKAVEGASITFDYRKVDTPTEDKMLATRTYFDVNTEDYIFTDTLEVTLVDGKAEIKADTVPTGYKLVDGETGVREVSKSQSTASFKVIKIDKEEPVEPTNEDKFITVNVDVKGNDLGQNIDTVNFEEVSRKTEKSVETLENGNTVTTHTTTITWKAKDVYVPVHTEETIVVNVDTNGTTISNTSNYNYVSESTDNGIVTTSENGDTHTVYTKTVVWKLKETTPNLPHPSNYGGKYTTVAELIVGESEGTLYDGVGNTGATFPTLMDASLFALDTLAEMGTGGNYWTWQVKFLDGTVWYTTSIFPK